MTSLDLELFCFRIKDYENQALIKNLPPNHKYKFKVMVYDSGSKEWSEMSDSSAEIDMTISKPFA